MMYVIVILAVGGILLFAGYEILIKRKNKNSHGG